MAGSCLHSMLSDPHFTRLSEKFYLLRKIPKSRDLCWDPWPVKNFEADSVYREALDIIKRRNEENVDNYADSIVLLPASNSIPWNHGGTANTNLYSVRSPSKLPVRIHLWRTRRGKIMVQKGIRSLTLIEFLKTFELKSWSGPCKHYEFWKSLQPDDKALRRFKIPEHLNRAIHERWWAINGFRFLDLPAELREIILNFAIGHVAEPYALVYRPLDCLPLRDACTNLVLVNRQLRREAIPILLSQVTFVFRQHGQLLRFFEQIPKTSLYALQSLELRFNHDTLLDFFGAQVFRTSPDPGYSTSDYYLKDSLFTNKLKLRHIRIYFPHPREHLGSKKLKSACQRTVCLWIWAAARRCLRDIPHVEFEGCIKDDQKKEWLETLALEREGILTDPKEIEDWQKHVWSADPRFCNCDHRCSEKGDFYRVD